MQAIAQPAAVEAPSNRTANFSIVCSAHFINHFQSAMLGVIYPLMMKELGMSYLAIASLASVYNTLGSILQASYGFIVPYFRRGVILGVGNCLLGLSVFASGFASTFNHFFTARLIGGIGSSPQHPVGSSMLASDFGTARGRILAFHSTAGQIGSLVAPILAAFFITRMSWRSLFLSVGILATLVGLICFVFRDSLRAAQQDQLKSRLRPMGWEAYKARFKNKDILLVSLVFMAGAAGRGQDINEVYIMPHFVCDFHLDLNHAAFIFTFIQVGSLIGPFIWGWISDRYNRKLVIKASLLLSGIRTLWLAWQQSVQPGYLLIWWSTAQLSLHDKLSPRRYSPTWSATISLMQRSAFTTLNVISISYLIAMSLLTLLRMPNKQESLATLG